MDFFDRTDPLSIAVRTALEDNSDSHITGRDAGIVIGAIGLVCVAFAIAFLAII